MNPVMKLNVHGSRGSIPTSSGSTVGYGGNTSCYELAFGNYQIFFDTGSGFRNANFLESSKSKIIFYSHWHHDHIQGLPFNAGIFNPENRFLVSSALASRNVVRNTLQTYFSGGYFPVDIIENLSNFTYSNINSVKNSHADDFELNWIELNHPGGCYGYSVVHGGKKFCYLCDNEYETSQLDALLKFADEADVVIWDGMFTEAELDTKRGWGHSSIEQGIFFSENCGHAQVLISHHAPARLDSELQEIQEKLPDRVSFARDGLTLRL